MTISYNSGSSPEAVTFDGTDLEKVTFDGTTVWEKVTSGTWKGGAFTVTGPVFSSSSNTGTYSIVNTAFSFTSSSISVSRSSGPAWSGTVSFLVYATGTVKSTGSTESVHMQVLLTFSSGSLTVSNMLNWNRYSSVAIPAGTYSMSSRLYE